MQLPVSVTARLLATWRKGVFMKQILNRVTIHFFSMLIKFNAIMLNPEQYRPSQSSEVRMFFLCLNIDLRVLLLKLNEQLIFNQGDREQ